MSIHDAEIADTMTLIMEWYHPGLRLIDVATVQSEDVEA